MAKVYIKKSKGQYVMLYPDPGWVPCSVDCKLCGGKPLERPLVESHFRTDTYKEMERTALADGHTVEAWKGQKYSTS